MAHLKPEKRIPNCSANLNLRGHSDGRDLAYGGHMGQAHPDQQQWAAMVSQGMFPAHMMSQCFNDKAAMGGFYPNMVTGGMLKTEKQVYNPGPVSPPPVRERFSYTRYQVELLNGIFCTVRYPNSMQKQLIAKRVGITRDQVKIWFQNRRRKEITGKLSKVDEQTAAKMVPDEIMRGIVTELQKYQNDPKGKKIKEATKNLTSGSKSVKRSLSPTSLQFSPVDENSNGFNPNNSGDCAVQKLASTLISPSSSSTSSYPLTPASSTEPSPVRIISANLTQATDLDIISPPNMVAPNAGISPDSLKRPPSVESPVGSCAQVDNEAHPEGPPAKKLRLAHSNPENETKNPPPNKVAPPSKPINFNAQLQNQISATSKHNVVPNTMVKSPQNIAAEMYGNLSPYEPDDFIDIVKANNYNKNTVNPSCAMPNTAHSPNNSTEEPDWKCYNNGERFYSIPLMADSPMMFPANPAAQEFPPQNNPYAAHNHAQFYQPFMISSFNNPYYGYDMGNWHVPREVKDNQQTQL